MPAASVLAVSTWPRSMLIRVTLALGMTAPDGSCTTPVMVPWSACPNNSGIGASRRASTRQANFDCRIDFMCASDRKMVQSDGRVLQRRGRLRGRARKNAPFDLRGYVHDYIQPLIFTTGGTLRLVCKRCQEFF